MKTHTSKPSAKQAPVLSLGNRTLKAIVTGTAGQNKPRISDDLHACITTRAYELYVERGCREGGAEQDWLDAEQEILNRTVSV